MEITRYGKIVTEAIPTVESADEYKNRGTGVQR